MGIEHSYANFTKQQRFSLGAFGESGKRYAFGYTLASRAFHLLLAGFPSADRSVSSSLTIGSWAGDSVAIVGDDQVVPNWEKFEREFTDIAADAILIVFHFDGFEQIGEAAQRDESFFMQLCHLVASRQAMELEPYLKQSFGRRYMHHYNQLCALRTWFVPKNLSVMPGR